MKRTSIILFLITTLILPLIVSAEGLEPPLEQPTEQTTNLETTNTINYDITIEEAVAELKIEPQQTSLSIQGDSKQVTSTINLVNSTSNASNLYASVGATSIPYMDKATFATAETAGVLVELDSTPLTESEQLVQLNTPTKSIEPNTSHNASIKFTFTKNTTASNYIIPVTITLKSE